MVIKADLIEYITNALPFKKGYGISKLRKSQSGGLVDTQVESYDSSRVNTKWVKIADGKDGPICSNCSESRTGKIIQNQNEYKRLICCYLNS